MRFQYRVPVRFRDVDALGHVHHTVPLLYLEEARAAYWREVAGRAMVADIDYVMGEVTVRYARRIEYPSTVVVGVRVSELGRRSFRMEFEIRSEEGELLASGSTTQVMYDYARGQSVDISVELRGRIERYESGSAEC